MHLMSYFLHVFTIMTVFGPPREMFTVVCLVSNVLFLSQMKMIIALVVVALLLIIISKYYTKYMNRV